MMFGVWQFCNCSFSVEKVWCCFPSSFWAFGWCCFRNFQEQEQHHARGRGRQAPPPNFRREGSSTTQEEREEEKAPPKRRRQGEGGGKQHRHKGERAFSFCPFVLFPFSFFLFLLPFPFSFFLFLSSEIKTQMIGEAADLNKQLQILNRTVRWCSRGLWIEADPRHVKAVIKALGLKGRQSSPHARTRGQGRKHGRGQRRQHRPRVGA